MSLRSIQEDLCYPGWWTAIGMYCMIPFLLKPCSIDPRDSAVRELLLSVHLILFMLAPVLSFRYGDSNQRRYGPIFIAFLSLVLLGLMMPA